MVTSNGNKWYPEADAISSTLTTSEFSLSEQLINFGNSKEISVGMTFPVQLDNRTFGRGYYNLDQQQKKQGGGYHIPVLVNEVVNYLITNKNGVFLDCTIGGGGHAEAILNHTFIEAKLLGMDHDFEAIEYCKQRLEKWKSRTTLEHCNFNEFDLFFKKIRIDQVDGILIDLGVSSHQIDAAYRGFSFMHDGPLDMRMDREQKQGAFQIVNLYSELELRRVIREYGEERKTNSIVREIIKSRMKEKIDSTGSLAAIVSKVVYPKDRNKTLARVFQSLRIEVNSEMKNLKDGLKLSIKYLKTGGRLIVLSYHSLEDRMVKQFFKDQEQGCTCPPEFPLCVCDQKSTVKILTKHPITPSEQEIKTNNRARSVKMRVIERI